MEWLLLSLLGNNDTHDCKGEWLSQANETLNLFPSAEGFRALASATLGQLPPGGFFFLSFCLLGISVFPHSLSPHKLEGNSPTGPAMHAPGLGKATSEPLPFH